MVSQKEIIEALRWILTHETWQDLYDLADEIEAEGIAPPDGWQPIETAPIDGRAILLAVGNLIGSGRFRQINAMIPSKSYFFFDGAYLPSGATHWMPLPEPPKGVSNEQ